MIKKLLVFFLFVTPALAADEYLSAPNESPIVSLSIPFNGKLNRSAPFTALEPGSVAEIQNMKRIAPGAPGGWTVRKGMTKHNTTTPLNSGEDVKALFQYVNKDFGTRLFMSQVDNGSSGDLIYSADDDPPATGTNFSSTAIYTMSAAAGTAFADHINDDWVGAANGVNPWAWSGGTAYPDGFLVTEGEEASASPTITNSDFETSADGVLPTGWTEYDPDGESVSTTEAGTGVSASKSLKIAVTDGSGYCGGVYQDITANPYTGYAISFYANSIAEFPYYKVECLDSGDVVLSTPKQAYITFSSLGTYESVEFSFETPVGTAKIRLYLLAYQSGAGTETFDIWFDNVTITAYSTGSSKWRDGYAEVRNSDTTKSISFLNDTVTSAYIGYRRRINGVYLALGSTKNSETSTMTVQALRDGEWTTVSGMSDGTSTDGGATTLEQSGVITWTYGGDDGPFLDNVNNDHLFWYKFTASNDLTEGIEVYQARVYDSCQAVANLSCGIWQSPDAVFTYEPTTYTDKTTEVTDDDNDTFLAINTFGTTDYVYIGCASKIFALYVDPYTFANTTQSDGLSKVEYWNGYDWTELETVIDGTHDGVYAFGNAGIIQWDPTEASEQGLLFTDPGVGYYPPLPLFWYRLGVTGTSYLKCVELAVMDKPGEFPQYNGVIGYHSRALWWPGNTIKSGVDYSQDGRSDILNGGDSGGTGNIFGDGEVNGIVLMNAGAIVSTKNPYRIYSLSGYTPEDYQSALVSDTVGAAAPHTIKFIGGGSKLFSRDTMINATIFMGVDGFYMTDGSTVLDISSPISDYFDTSSTPYIEPSLMEDSYAWVDQNEKTIHFAVPIHLVGGSAPTELNRELVYSYLADEWYDLYSRSSPASCGLSIVGSDDRAMPYIGDYSGVVWRTDYGTADGTSAINHFIKTSPVSLLSGSIPDYLNYKVDVRGIKLKAGADTTSGSVAQILAFPDGKTVGVTVGDVSLERTGYLYINDYMPINSGTTGTPMTAEEVAFMFDNDESVLNSVMTLYGFTVDFNIKRPTY